MVSFCLAELVIVGMPIGTLRSVAQVSYEVSIGLILISNLLVVGSLNFIDLTDFQRIGFLWFHCYPCL